jgi:hypothetical protein
MTSTNRYDPSYVDACRASVERQITAYDALTQVARDLGEAPLHETLATFEPLFFTNMVLVLDAYFADRNQTMEGQDGGALGEVRLLRTSILENGGLLLADEAITDEPDGSLLHYAAGDVIALNESDFLHLSDAFFAAIEATYP